MQARAQGGPEDLHEADVVCEEEGDMVAPAQAHGEPELGEAVGAGVECAIGQHLAGSGMDQCRFLRRNAGDRARISHSVRSRFRSDFVSD